MKLVRDIMSADVVWVSPSARVKTAVILTRGHEIGALPVVASNDAVVGLVTLQGILGQPPEAAVSEVMQTEFAVVAPDMSVHDAAEVMRQARASHLLVIENERLAGIVSHFDLIGELGRNFDPLTEMPWSDALREWAMDALKRGHEISVVFFDLDHFRAFNSNHGHPIGDAVIRQTASVIRAGIDEELDMACRYGGDEFAIVSVRNADEATELADALQRRVSQIKIENVSEAVSATYGMSGGRRTKEREDVHYAATIDDLITRASKDCLARKAREPEPAEAAAAQQPAQAASAAGSAPGASGRLRIRTINISTTGAEATVGVVLTLGGRSFRREAGGYVAGGPNLLRLVAEATAGAACKSLGEGHGIVVDEVRLEDAGRDEPVVSVAAVFIAPGFSVRHVGSAVVRRGDLHRAAAAALLAAVNRLVEVAPRAEEEARESPGDSETAGLE